jgi:hypothetical protein
LVRFEKKDEVFIRNGVDIRIAAKELIASNKSHAWKFYQSFARNTSSYSHPLIQVDDLIQEGNEIMNKVFLEGDFVGMKEFKNLFSRYLINHYKVLINKYNPNTKKGALDANSIFEGPKKDGEAVSEENFIETIADQSESVESLAATNSYKERIVMVLGGNKDAITLFETMTEPPEGVWDLIRSKNGNRKVKISTGYIKQYLNWNARKFNKVLSVVRYFTAKVIKEENLGENVYGVLCAGI